MLRYSCLAIMAHMWRHCEPKWRHMMTSKGANRRPPCLGVIAVLRLAHSVRLQIEPLWLVLGANMRQLGAMVTTCNVLGMAEEEVPGMTRGAKHNRVRMSRVSRRGARR
ncbi:hypothetical protein GCM10010359_00360 [Streptomyces morookaense]|nr:hypothetical protein GCM10010359_00360 [Streptomyces morookaense]